MTDDLEWLNDRVAPEAHKAALRAYGKAKADGLTKVEAHAAADYAARRELPADEAAFAYAIANWAQALSEPPENAL